MHKHWHRLKFIQRRMMDLPEKYQRQLPASEDETTLISAEEAIRHQYAADQRASEAPEGTQS